MPGGAGFDEIEKGRVAQCEASSRWSVSSAGAATRPGGSWTAGPGETGRIRSLQSRGRRPVIRRD